MVPFSLILQNKDSFEHTLLIQFKVLSQENVFHINYELHSDIQEKCELTSKSQY